MPLEPIELEILTLIRDFNDGKPVGLQPLDRMLITNHANFTFSGKLQEKIKNMEKDNLIYLSTKGGYLLTEYGKEFLL